MAQMEAEFDGTPASAHAARRFVARALASWGLEDAESHLELLTSELVTNAVCHARTPYHLVVACEGPRVRVEVRDGSAARPTARRARPDADAGRGLMIVDALADRWGIEEDGPGKSVWFVLDLGRRSQAAGPLPTSV